MAVHIAELLNAAIRKTPAVKILNFMKSVNFSDLALRSNVEISTHPGNVDLKLLIDLPNSGLLITDSWIVKLYTLNSKISDKYAH
jgi:hypothetical protein